LYTPVFGENRFHVLIRRKPTILGRLEPAVDARKLLGVGVIGAALN